jgi:hypothetical protein
MTATAPTPSILVSYIDEPVALVNARHVTFLGPAAELPAGHPRLRLLIYMARYAQLVACRERPGPYTDADAERFARAALIEPAELRAHRRESDQDLAQRFRLPVEQIPPARGELLPTTPPRWRPRGR